MRTWRKILPWSLAGGLVLIIVALAGLRIACERYLQSAAFRRMLDETVSKELQASGAFQPLQIAHTTAYSDGYRAIGSDEAFFHTLRADQIRAELDWRGLLHRTCKLDSVTLERLEIQLPETAAIPSKEPVTKSAEPKSKTKRESDGWKVDLREARVRDARFRWGNASLPAGEASGTSLLLRPDGENWTIDANGGRLTQTGWPEMQLDSARLRCQEDAVFITSATLKQGQGTVDLSGDIHFDEATKLRAQLRNVDVSPFVTGDWRTRITGQLFADITLASDSPSKPLTASGSARLENAKLTALPILDQIATFTQSQRFRQISLTTATCDFTNDAKQFTATNLVLESAGLIRIEGRFAVGGDQILGEFQIGITPSSLQWLPGSRSRVFTVARDGYVWATMKLSGPLSHPDEDLSQRLITAAAGEVIDTTKSTILETTNLLLNKILR